MSPPRPPPQWWGGHCVGRRGAGLLYASVYWLKPILLCVGMASGSPSQREPRSRYIKNSVVYESRVEK